MAWIEPLSQRWENTRMTIGQGVALAVAAGIIVLVAGFGMGGWMTESKARTLADEAATTARHELAAAVCAEEFGAGTGANARLVKLQALQWHERSDAVAKGGWATMPDRKEPNPVVAGMCAARLSELPSPAAPAK